MPKNKKIIIIVLVSLSLLGVLFFNFNEIVEEKLPSANPIGNSYGVKTILKINEVSYEYEITSQTTVYDFMDKLRTEGKINFKEKNYTGIGKFIIEINGIKGNGDKNWIYYVNGIEAQVGVSNYKIKPGDIVSWKYESQ